MPASMINAPTGGNPNVIGRSMATVATVPMPGSTPTSVPTSAPSKQNPMLYGCTATEKPSARLARSSLMAALFSVPGPKLKRQLQQIDEETHAERCHRHSGDQTLHPPHFGRAADRDHEGRKCGRDQPQRRNRDESKMNAADHAGERKYRKDDPSRTTDCIAIERRAVEQQSTERNQCAGNCEETGK